MCNIPMLNVVWHVHSFCIWAPSSGFLNVWLRVPSKYQARLYRWGHEDDLAKRIVRCGKSGAHKGHVLESLLRAANHAGLMSSLARPYLAEIPGAGNKNIVARVFLPHEGLFELVDSKPLSEWTLPPQVLANTGGLGGLVKQWAQHPDVTSHPDPQSVIAIGLHADGVQYTSTLRAGGVKSVYVMSWNVISARTVGDRAQRRLLAVLTKSRMCDCGCAGFHTLQGVWEIVAWSFRHLMAGVAPSRRHDDSEFSRADTQHRIRAGSRLPYAAVLQLRGDWEWFATCFRFRAPSQERFCFLCDAEKSDGDLYAYDFSPNAPFRNTLITHEIYLRRCAAEHAQPCGLFQVPGVRLEHVCIDSMHTADLGVFPDALGSLFDLEISCRAFYGSRAAGLQRLNYDLTQFYRAHPGLSQVTPLCMQQIKAPNLGYPFLKCKAAQARHLAEFGLTLARRQRYGGGGRPPFAFPRRHRMAARTDEHLNLNIELFEGMTTYCRSLAAPQFDPQECKRGMLKFLTAFGALHRLWRDGVQEDDQKTLPYHLRPKAHMLHHLVLDQLEVHGSPAATWCYADESFVGSIKRVAGSTKHPNTLEQRVGEKAMLKAGLVAFEASQGLQCV